MTVSSALTRRKGGTLLFITLCLLASGVLRIGGNEAAIAEELSARRATEMPAGEHIPVTQQCENTGPPGSLLEAIVKRQDQLDEREARLKNRLQALNVAEQQIKENLQALVEAEKKLAATLSIADNAAEDDLSRLTAVYENMKPKNAAGVFGEMAPEFAAGFLGRMRADSAAAILSNLPSERAYSISLVLAGRNALAPKR